MKFVRKVFLLKDKGSAVNFFRQRNMVYKGFEVGDNRVGYS